MKSFGKGNCGFAAVGYRLIVLGYWEDNRHGEWSALHSATLAALIDSNCPRSRASPMLLISMSPGSHRLHSFAPLIRPPGLPIYVAASQLAPFRLCRSPHSLHWLMAVDHSRGQLAQRFRHLNRNEMAGRSSLLASPSPFPWKVRSALPVRQPVVPVQKRADEPRRQYAYSRPLAIP